MKASMIVAASACFAGLCCAQTPNWEQQAGSSQHRTWSPSASCLLSGDCLSMSKIPATACRVTGKNAGAKAACAVDGMKFVGKLTS